MLLVSFQVQKWLGNEKNPLDWGWIRSTQGLIPQLMTKPPAPQPLLNMISCNCKKGCTNNCGCRKAGLKCSAVCRHCSGQSCENIPDLIFDDIDESLIDANDHRFRNANEANCPKKKCCGFRRPAWSIKDVQELLVYNT